MVRALEIARDLAALAAGARTARGLSNIGRDMAHGGLDREKAAFTLKLGEWV